MKKIINKLKEIYKTKNKKEAANKIIYLASRLQYKCFSYIRNKLKLPYHLNKKQIELEITTFCHRRCLNCDRSCRQAPSDERMSVEQIKKFIKESKEFNKKWEQIRILGGEPTFHPDIIEICNLLLEYKNKYSNNTRIRLFTNGFGPKVQNVLKIIPEGIEIRNSQKETPIHLFSSYNIATVDLKEFQDKNIDYSKGCPVIESCGLGLTRYGYFACGAGASVDRIFGWDIGIKKMSLINDSALRKQLKILCKYCGHYKDWGRHKPNNGPILVKKEVMSESWVKAYAAQKKKKPKLSLY